MKRIFLLRHPHVDAAEEGICYGSSHVPLSSMGEKQARIMAEFLSRHPIDAVYASDLPRAAEPAGLIAKQQGVELELVPKLREVDCGDWEGLTYDEIKNKYPDLYEQWFSLDGSFCFPGGENISDFRDRILRAFAEIVGDDLADGESNIAVVTHSGVTRIILMDLLHMPMKAAWQLGQDFASLNIIEYYSECAILKLLNGSCC